MVKILRFTQNVPEPAHTSFLFIHGTTDEAVPTQAPLQRSFRSRTALRSYCSDGITESQW